MSRIYVLHENDAWTAPLRAALEERGLPHEAWHLDEGRIDMASAPPEGVFYSRMSASSHTRGHRYAPELTGVVLTWLESHGRRVVNGSRALRLEVNKVAQYAALETAGIVTPHTVATVGREALLEAAKTMAYPLVTKHNRGGTGLGVRLFEDAGSLREYVLGPDFEPSVDGITLLQSYIEAPEPFITRMEFIGGRFFYAVRVDTSEGFLLCPADSCEVPGEARARPKFEIIEGFTHPLVPRLEGMLAGNGIEVAGVEFILDRAGKAFTYDINTNTNYNSAAEAVAGRSGMGTLADFLGTELAALPRRRPLSLSAAE